MAARINLGGTYGPQTITVARDGQTASRTASLTPPAPDGADGSVYALHETVPRECGPISVTGASHWNGHEWGSGFSPTVMATQMLAQSVSGNTIVMPDLGMFSSYNPSFYIGGQIEIRRLTNGVMSLVGHADVDGAAFPQYDNLFSNSRGISGTSFTRRMDSFNKLGATYWYSVQAITADNKIGARSAWVPITPTAEGVLTSSQQPDITLTGAREDGSLPAPTGVTVTGPTKDVTVTWDPVDGAAAYQISIAYSDPATWPASVGQLVVANATGAAQAGDMILWRKKLLTITPDQIGSRIWGVDGTPPGMVPDMVGPRPWNQSEGPAFWEYRAWDENDPKPADDLGRYYVHRRIAAGVEKRDGMVWASHGFQTGYYVKRPGDVLRVEVWLRSKMPITAKWSGGHPGEPDQNVNIGTTWQKYTLTSDYIPASYPAGSAVSSWRFIFNTPAGVEYEVDWAGLKVSLAALPWGRYRPDVEASLVAGSAFRDHGLIKTHPKSYDWMTATAPAGEGRQGWSIPMHLAFCRERSLVPWLQIEWAQYQDDWAHYVEWIADNMADFETILLEIGNENWNYVSGFWTIPHMVDAATGLTVDGGAVYGAICKLIHGWMSSHPRWSEVAGKIKFVLGGHGGSAYGENAYRQFPEADIVTIAQYNGGWDTGTDKALEDGTTFRRTLRFQGGPKTYITREASLAEAAAAVGKVVGVDVFHDLYEAGPGYQLNGMNNVSVSVWESVKQEAVQKSRASAAAQLDAICLAWQRGWTSNFFYFGRGDGWKSHGDDWTEYLTYSVGRVLGESLGRFRAHILHPVSMRVTDGVDDVGVYAFESVTHPGRWIYIAVNRVPDLTVLAPDDPMYDAEDTGTRSVTFRTHHSSLSSCRVFLGGIGNMREHDRWPAGTRVDLDASKRPVVVEDPLCIDFDAIWHDMPVPADPARIVIDDALGADPDGLRGGNFIMVMVDGM